MRPTIQRACCSWPTARIAAAATSGSSILQELPQLAVEHVRAASRVAAPPRCGRAGLPHPLSATIAPIIARAASRFCARPGRARNAAIAARSEKSGKSPELLDPLERIDVRMFGRDRATPRCAPRGADRRAAARRRAAPEIVRGAREQSQRVLAHVGRLVLDERAHRGMHRPIVRHFEEAERVQDLLGRAGQASRAMQIDGRSLDARARWRARCRRDADECSRAGSRRIAGAPRPPPRTSADQHQRRSRTSALADRPSTAANSSTVSPPIASPSR